MINLKLKNFLKRILRPLRKIFTNFSLIDEKLANFNLKEDPIDIGANFIVSEEIQGDYLEFGVFQGSSFIKAYNSITNYTNLWSNFNRTKQAYSDEESAKKAFSKISNINRKFYAFDSFKGLPELSEIDKDHPKFTKGRYNFSKKNFIKVLIENNINLKKVEIIEGFYDSTLNEDLKVKLKLNKAAMIMIDCDLYESTKDVLKFITDMVHTGTVIIFDDWYTYKSDTKKGQQYACSEWLKNNTQIKLIDYKELGPFQKSFIVNISKFKNI